MSKTYETYFFKCFNIYFILRHKLNIFFEKKYLKNKIHTK
jgi:hypothetical protein